MFKRDQEKKTKARTVDSSEYDLAKADSKDCEFCNGQGMRLVYLPWYRGDPIVTSKTGERFLGRVAAYCRCPLGMFMRDHAKPDEQRRTPWVEDICRGKSRWLLDDPTESKVLSRESNDPVSAESFRIFRRRLAASFRDRDRQLPDALLCPRCRQPMGGGRGGMPFTCFRSCGRKRTDVCTALPGLSGTDGGWRRWKTLAMRTRPP